MEYQQTWRYIHCQITQVAIFNGFDSSAPNYAKICKYTFFNSSVQCQTITSINIGYGSLMLSSTQFFIISADSVSPYSLRMYKITFATTAVNWANKITCSSGIWQTSASESQLSLDGSIIYSFFIYGSTKYLYFASLYASNGTVVSSRFKSSISITSVSSSALFGDYVIALTNSPSLLIYNIPSVMLIVKSTSMSNLFSWSIELSSGR